MERHPGSPPVVARFRRALRWLVLVALGFVLLPATPMCALPRAPASGPEVAVLSTGPFCARGARGVRVSGEEAPSLAAEWGFVGLTPVARRLEQTGCGASGCDYRLTAWWWQGSAWVVVTGSDGETDALLGAGPPFAVTSGAIAAACGPGDPAGLELEKPPPHLILGERSQTDPEIPGVPRTP